MTSKRLRILFLNQYLPPDVSATARRLADIAQHLAQENEVWVLAGRPSYDPDTRAEPLAGVHVVRTRSSSVPRTTMVGRSLNYLSYLLGTFMRVWTLPRPDIVVAMTDPPFIGLVGALFCRRRRIPFIQVYMDLYPDIAVALGRADARPLVWAWHRLNLYTRATADRIVVVGRDMRERLMSQGVPGHKIVVRPNWAEEPDVDPTQVAAVRADKGWDGRSVVMFAGNIGLAQGLETLVQAAAQLRQRDDIVIVLLGDGAARGKLQDETRRLRLTNVRFLSYVPHEEAHLLIASADVHVILLAPGLWGTAVPGKVYGVMAAGKPFVAAVDAGSEIDRIVAEHRCGLRVQPGDASGLAEAIASVVGARASEMGMRGREAFLAEYTLEKAVDEYATLIQEVARLHDSGQRAG